MNKIILDLCGGSSAWSKYYKMAGYDVRLITLPDNDVRTYQPPDNVYGVLAAPPCTNFSLVLSEKIERDFSAGMEIVNACMRIAEQCNPVFWALENPIGHLSKFIGQPAFIFQPWEFGDPWTKRTGIWGKFNHPKKLYSDWNDVPKNDALYIRKPRKKPNMVWLHKSAYDLIPAYHDLPRPETDAAFRAMTPQGFSRQFYEANQ
jgi:hypothetical protein